MLAVKKAITCNSGERKNPEAMHDVKDIYMPIPWHRSQNP
jgi:hypothetical protein